MTAIDPAARPDLRTPRPVIDTPWLTVSEAAQYARHSTDYVRAALASGELRGSQRTNRGRWLTRVDWIDAWLAGEVAPLVVPAVTRKRQG